MNENYCNFCGTPDSENPERKCACTAICTNEKKTKLQILEELGLLGGLKKLNNEHKKILCDFCKMNLTTTGNSIDDKEEYLSKGTLYNQQNNIKLENDE